MFFGLKYSVASSFCKEIQVWKTTKEIVVLFLVEYLNDMSRTISALPILYKNIFPAESSSNFNDLDIKHWDIKRRNKFARKLFDNYEISGWFTSVEDKVELEICLFDKQANSEQLILIDIGDRKNETYFKDSLDRIEIFYTEEFYNKTKERLDEQAPVLTDEQDHYKRYKKWVNASINEYVQNGMTQIKARHYLLDLRTKLKI